jgi:hypothetical protein
MSEDNYTRILTKFRDRALEIIKSIDYSIDKDAPGIIIAVGNGAPDYVKQTLESISPRTILLYYTLDDSQSASLSNLFPSGNVLFSSLSEETYYSDKAGVLTALCPDRKIIFSIPVELEKQISEKLKKIQEALNDALSNAAQSNIARLLYLRNSLFNMKRVLSSREIKISFDGFAPPAIICGAGPSLKDQLEILKKYQSKFLIFCVGRIAPALIEAGIMPDLMFQTDSHILFDAEWIKTIPEGLCPPLAAALSIYPPVANPCFDKILWFYGDAFSVNDFLKKHNCRLSDFTLSKTVIVSAIDFAVRFGCKNIALIGSDLCISESGGHHLDEKQGTESAYAGITETDGNNGMKVMTIPELADLKNVLEKYIATQKLEINNCTERGAKITGAPFMKLEEFFQKYSTVKKGQIISEKRCIASPDFKIEEILESLEKYAFILKALVLTAHELCAELAKTSPDFEKAAETQEKLRKHCQMESNLRQSSLIDFVISPVEEQIAEILNECPDTNGINQTSPSVQLSLLIKRYSFIMDFCFDIANDLRCSNAQEANNLHIFKSFENYAISFIAHNNRELAEFLKLNRASNYSFVCMEQYLPFTIINPDGSVFIKRDVISSELEIKSSVKLFAEENSFDSNSMALVFPAPGDWRHVVEFAKIHSDADIIVLEPWLEMFAGIIQHSMFIHYLPEKTLVIGVDEKLHNWRELFTSRIKEWKDTGKKILVYETPETKQKDEKIRLLEELDSICGT